MAGFTAIADVGETLIELLRDRMDDLVSSSSIVLGSPGEISAQESPRLCLFLYQVLESASLKNQKMLNVNSTTMQYPPLTLDLFYMLTCYGATQNDRTVQSMEEHTILGRAMNVLSDNAVLRGSALKGSLEGTDEEFRVTLNPVSLDELDRLWNSFNDKSFKLSICYIVSPVRIDSTRMVEAKRVLEKESGYYQTSQGRN
jgi:hypothetical protein